MVGKFWTLILAFGMSMGTLMMAQGSAPQEPSAPANPPHEGANPHGRPERGGMVENRLERLSKQLNLTADQKEKIRPILRHEAERIREIHENTSLSQEEARRRMGAVRRNTNERIAEFLTPEQKKQWQEIREERRGGPEGGHEPGGHRAPEPPPNPPSPPNSN